MTAFLAGLALKAVTRFPFLAAVPWKLVGAALLAIALFSGGWTVRGWKEAGAKLAVVEQARKQERDAFAKRDRLFAEQQGRDQELLMLAAAEREELERTRNELQKATAGLPLTRTQTRVIHESCTCDDTRLAPSIRVCFNAAASGDTADLAACEAQRVPGGL